MSLLPFSLYVYGLAFGPMISAPISEVFGRRLIYLLMSPISLLFILGAGFANNLATLLICRFFAGLIGASPLAVGAGTIMDIWGAGQLSSRAIIIFMSTAFLGPALGSLVGGFVAEYKSWRWSQWTTLFLGAAVWIFALFAQETYASPLIRRKAKRLGLPLPPQPIPSGIAGVQLLLTATLTRPLHMLICEPAVGLFSLYASFTFSVLFCFLASFPLIYGSVYGFSSGKGGLVFIGIAVGCILGATILILIEHLVHERQQSTRSYNNTSQPPEVLLYGAMVGSPLMPVALFLFAWTARPGVHWMVSIIATALFGCANILIFVRLLSHTFINRFSGSLTTLLGILRSLSDNSIRRPLWCFSAGCEWVPSVYTWRLVSPFHNYE